MKSTGCPSLLQHLFPLHIKQWPLLSLVIINEEEAQACCASVEPIGYASATPLPDPAWGSPEAHLADHLARDDNITASRQQLNSNAITT